MDCGIVWGYREALLGLYRDYIGFTDIVGSLGGLRNRSWDETFGFQGFRGLGFRDLGFTVLGLGFRVNWYP